MKTDLLANEDKKIEIMIFTKFKPGKYIMYDYFHRLYSNFPNKDVNRKVKQVIKSLLKTNRVKKGYAGFYYVTDETGASPFYSKDIKLSKRHMDCLKQNDIKKKSGEKAIKILKAKSEDSSYNFYNYKYKREIKNKLTSKKCRICGKPAYCMHHILPLCKGGDNRKSNLIPVCIECHKKIHPFML